MSYWKSLATVRNNDVVYIKFEAKKSYEKYSNDIRFPFLPQCSYMELWLKNPSSFSSDQQWVTLTQAPLEGNVFNIIRIGSSPSGSWEQQYPSSPLDYNPLRYGDIVYISMGPAGAYCLGNWAQNLASFSTPSASKQPGAQWDRAHWKIVPYSDPNHDLMYTTINAGEALCLENMASDQSFATPTTYSTIGYCINSRANPSGPNGVRTPLQILPKRSMFFDTSTSTKALNCDGCMCLPSDPLTYGIGSEMTCYQGVCYRNEVVGTQASGSHVWTALPGQCVNEDPPFNAAKDRYITPYDTNSLCCVAGNDATKKALLAKGGPQQKNGGFNLGVMLGIIVVLALIIYFFLIRKRNSHQKN